MNLIAVMFPQSFQRGSFARIRLCFEILDGLRVHVGARAELVDVGLLVRQRRHQRLPVGETSRTEPDLVPAVLRRSTGAGSLVVEVPDLVRFLHDDHLDVGEVHPTGLSRLVDRLRRPRQPVAAIDNIPITATRSPREHLRRRGTRGVAVRVVGAGLAVRAGLGVRLLLGTLRRLGFLVGELLHHGQNLLPNRLGRPDHWW
jgi:hypothetical protein